MTLGGKHHGHGQILRVESRLRRIEPRRRKISVNFLDTRLCSPYQRFPGPVGISTEEFDSRRILAKLPIDDLVIVDRLDSNI
jgi:hypothetical protein